MTRAPVQYLGVDHIEIAWTCAKCGAANVLTDPNLTISGGCGGHREGEYCYCGSPEAETSTACATCHILTTLRIA